MLEGKIIKNKKIEKEEVKIKISDVEVAQQDFFFPDYSITISATSRKEAEEKFKEVIQKAKSKLPQ